MSQDVVYKPGPVREILTRTTCSAFALDLGISIKQVISDHP